MLAGAELGLALVFRVLVFSILPINPNRRGPIRWGIRRPRTLAAYDGPPLRVSEAVNRYVASLKPEEELCSEDMWLRTLAKKCGANVKKKDLQDTCCAFKEPFPEVALLTGARKKNLMVPNEEKRKAVAAKPLWGFRHDPGADAVMGLGLLSVRGPVPVLCGESEEDGVPGRHRHGRRAPEEAQRKVEEYLRNQRVLSYPFEYSCSQKGMSRRRLLATPGGCVLDDWYVEGDSRGPRPLALARYEMYETWLRQYSSTSYALVLDTRDTFFQRDPFCFRCLFFGLAPSRGLRGPCLASRWRRGAPSPPRRPSRARAMRRRDATERRDGGSAAPWRAAPTPPTRRRRRRGARARAATPSATTR